MRQTRIFLLLSLLSILLLSWGCAYTNPYYQQTKYTADDDEEKLIEYSIQRALFGGEKSLYDVIRGDTVVYLLNVRTSFLPAQQNSDSLTQSKTLAVNFIPQFKRVRLELISPEVVRKKVNGEEVFYFLRLGNVTMNAHHATVEVGLECAFSRPVVNLCGGGVVFPFEHVDDAWKPTPIRTTWDY